MIEANVTCPVCGQELVFEVESNSDITVRCWDCDSDLTINCDISVDATIICVQEYDDEEEDDALQGD